MNLDIVSWLSEQTGMAPVDIGRIALTAPYRYKVYSIPKRGGRGERVIAQPAREVKLLQRLVVSKKLADLPVHDSSHGYVKGRGIRSNAARHQGSPYLLKMDFLNFFPSIKPSDFIQHLRKYAAGRFSDDEIALVSRLLFWIPKGQQDLRLSIGAPSSPFLSNTLMYDVDVSLSKVAADRGIVYTRYADDLTFSSHIAHALDDFPDMVRQLCSGCSYPSLRINRQKTVYASKKGRRVVTGLVITNEGGVSIGRERKRLIRAMAFRCSRSELNTEEMLKLRGLLAFASDVEPAFASQIRMKYLGEEV